MKKYYPIVLAFCTLMSCASAPEPTFKDGVYTNLEFGFSANLPEGWVKSDIIPPWVLREIPSSEVDDLKFMFTNTVPELGIMSKGRILASCSTLNLSWAALMEDRAKFRLQQIKKLDLRKTLLSGKPQVKEYFSKTYP